MEKTVIIEGEKIHHVGYRPFLLKEAMNRKIKNFQAENMIENSENGKEKQKVVVKMVGEEKVISEFVSFIKKTKNGNVPDFAKNCNVIMEEDKCSDEVLYTSDYRDRLAVEQQDNIVQGGLRIEGYLKDMNTKLGNIDIRFNSFTVRTEEHNKKIEKLGTDIGIFVSEQIVHNNKMDLYILEQKEHNLRLEKILEKLSEYNR